MLWKVWFCCASFLLISSTGALEQILSRCCNMGVRWAWENKTCTVYPGPVSNIAVEHQAPCLSTINACCQRNYRERQCTLGHASAKSGQECRNGIGQDGQFHKDCCEGCKLGLIAGAMGLNCEFQSLKLALGPPWDTSLTKCCIQAGGRQIPSNPNPNPARPETRTSETPRPGDRFNFRQETRDFCALFPGQLCSQNCITDGDSYKCTCNEGYKLLPDGKTCREDSSGRNTSTDYLAQANRTNREREHHRRSSGECPLGFLYNSQTQVCDDIDECATAAGVATCFPYKTCRNTIGSFLCEQLDRENERNQQCPPGYRYAEESSSCIDIDECAEGFDICVREIQYCINTPGGFDCQGKKEFNRYNCPAGYKFNNKTLNCEDVNECDEKLDSCDPTSEVCRNTAGAYECDVQCSEGYRYEIRVRSCQDVDECREGTHDCVIEKESCVNVPGSYQCHQLQNVDNNCPPGYEPNKNYTFLCKDTDECESGLHTCATTEKCVNEVGGYRCERISGPGITDNSIPDNNLSGEDSDEDGVPVEPSNRRALPENPRGQNNSITKDTVPPCSPGLRRPRPTRPGQLESCEDIDECTENNPCDSSQLCQNTVGSYYCHCRRGYYRDPITRACLDINECQTGQHNCQPSQRCDNSPGSFTCIRITGCGTGYTLNSQTGQCEDDDECLFGNNDCDTLGPEWQCKNTLGSFRCEKTPRTCPPGLTLAPNGECRTTCTSGYLFNSRGDCVDIDECLQTTSGGRGICPSHQQCVNTKGSYQCLSRIICPAGFEPDPSGTKCTDVDECEKGLHTCRGNQECLNRGGGYICQCPSGYLVSASGNCEDVNECTRYNGQVCSSNAECHNTPGSFRCECKEGFEQGTDNRTCTDVDECRTIPGLCEQTCINTWGSHKCSCGAGYTLSEDERTCRDVDECAQVKGGYLCIGNCVNTQGSFQCECPDGYRLGTDRRTCQDIDECLERTACRSDESCLNIRGGFRCNRITCPPGYQREGEQNDRCKKTLECSERDTQCLKQPLTISRNFLSFTSNIRIPAVGYVDIFTMRGPNWSGAVMQFNLDLKNSRAPHGVFVAGRNHFLLRRPTPHQAVIALSKPIAGPQDVELELTMEVYHRGTYAGSAVAQVVIVVTSYEY